MVQPTPTGVSCGLAWLQALAAAGREVAVGTAGAGYGATAGTLKGGIGTASITTGDGTTVGTESPHLEEWIKRGS